ncbi:class II glutamine amidotransferase [Desulfallas thermosapovorans]|uniref:Glutamate synthase domain-containing protein 1 n=1 Tax=Desulfallas thermosapovorans DSM 6562 TaxID=1121431 RepID=A0A5S4ZTC4_9FIRM|nr:glutamine amidotransferase family protein [Desulfallas thermosapovorans]TYO96212.1 glutamate synthase domain-containing protein 1 [Desulfallas thermosapovorans DSM 6562]
MLVKQYYQSERFVPDKEMDACGLFGVMHTGGVRFGGQMAIDAIKNMKVRGSGLGGGFAIYGLYPKYKEYYALHIIYQDKSPTAQKNVEAFLKQNFYVVFDEEIPTNPNIRLFAPPLAWRYFVAPQKSGAEENIPDDEYVINKVMYLNSHIDNAYVFSSGKDVGVFKGVGFPEEIADYFMLDDLYEGYIWTVHSRFPTNTPGWWGGAHPLSILDWTVVHNGEISSYGANRRFLEMHNYYCTLHTDTEVLAYAVDLLMRRQGLPIEVVAKIFAPPMWEAIYRMDDSDRELYTALRMTYAPLLMNGPFTVIVAHHNEMIGLTDRIRLRPITAGAKGDLVFLSSEEAAIRAVCPDLELAWTPPGGEPVVVRLHTRDHLQSLNKSI